MNYKPSMKNTELETVLELTKQKSIKTKDYLDVYTKLVHSASFRDNNIKNVINYIPFVLDDEGNTFIDEASINGNPFSDSISSGMLARISDDSYEDESTSILPSDEIQLFEEDNTLSEIINQKMISFRRGTIIPELNIDSPLMQNQPEQIKTILTNFSTVAASTINNNREDIMRMIQYSKYYPFAGHIWMPISYKTAPEEGQRRKNHRKIEVTPFNLDIDGTSQKLEEADWAIITEKIRYKEFRKRLKAGEYSELKINEGESYCEKIWNKESSYKFASKSFLEQAITRNNLLSSKPFTSAKVDKNGEPLLQDSNLYGVIEYMWNKDYEGKWHISIFLNGTIIGKTMVDEAIDVLPLVLFSESPDIDNNLDFNGNLAFKLISPQLTILDLNQKKKAATDSMAPIVTNVFIQSETEGDRAKENTEMLTRNNELSMLTVGVDNPQTANNTARVLLGSQVYTTYLKELDELIRIAIETMKLKAGLTSFVAGTESGSFNSQAGLDAMKVAGLEGEQDIVAAIEKALTKTAVMEAYFELIELGHKQYKKKNETGIVDNYRTNLSTALKNYKDILSFELETRYQEQMTQSILQTLIIPLSAQTGHFETTLGLLKQLPLTTDMKEGIDDVIANIERKMQEKQQMEQQAEMPQDNGAPEENENRKDTGSTKKEESKKKKTGSEAQKGKDAKSQKSTNSKGNQNK